jgi:Sulfatase
MTTRAADEASGAGVRPIGAVKRLLQRVPRALWWALLELFALTGLVIVQPLLDVTGKAPDFFLFHRVGRGQILLLVAAIVLLPTAAMWLVEMAALLLAGERVQGLVHLAMLTGLFVLLALELGKKLLPVRGRRLVLAALVVAAMVGVVYRRWPALKLWLRYLAPAPLVFALLFATTSPAAELILPSRLAGGSPMPTLTRPGEPLPPVVMIFFDAFPLQSLLDSKAEVDRKVYPNFAEFAADATWYRNATGVNAWTPYAVPAMLSGRYPDKSKQYQAPIAQAYPDNLFSLFGHYYDLKVFETVTQLCPPKRCGQTGTRSGMGVVAKEVAKLYLNIVAPVDVPVDPASMGESPTPTADTKMGSPTAYFGNLRLDQLGRVDRFMRSISATDRQPTLYFLHLLLPHGPHKYLPDGRIYRDPIGRGPVSKAGTWPDALTKVGHQRQLLQLAYTDKVLGTVIDRLKQQGLYDKSLVLLTADHGTGFSSTVRSRWIGGGNEPTLMWVPLFIKAPHQTSGRVDDRNWEHVDLLPTVADIAGLSVPWNGDGYSQVGPSKRRRTDKWWYDTPGERQVRPGPSYFRQVLGGVTDTLVRAHQRGERGLWQFGVTADWVYRSPRAIGRLAGGPVAAKVKDWSRFETVRPGSSPTPALVVGEVTSGTPPAGSTMVIAVNGRIGGTGGFYPPRPGGRPIAFAAMVPDFLFNPGPGQPQIQAYLATRSGGAVALRPVRLSG